VYYAKLVLEQGGQRIELDARPCDAVNVALRAKAPIMAEEALLGELSRAERAHHEGDKAGRWTAEKDN